MGGLFVRHLQDKLPKVSFCNLHATSFQGVIQVDFLGGDAFAFHNELGTVTPANIDDVAGGVLCRSCQVNMPTAPANYSFQGLEKLREIGNGIFLDTPGPVF